MGPRVEGYPLHRDGDRWRAELPAREGEGPAVVELVAFARMDDVPYASIRLAQQKASTSARLRLTTAELEERVQKGGRTVLLSSDEVIAIGGGVPIVVDGRIIGALGVSGGTAAQDAAVAEETVAPR